ncbi:MAG: choice-of-anchor D domain-containing protein, partial [Calditrichia bacterium]
LTVKANVTGASTQNFSTTVSSGTIDPGMTLDVTLTNNFDLTAVGTHVITLITDLSGEQNRTNDTLVIDFDVDPVVTFLPYIEDFESFTSGNPGILLNGWRNVPGDDFDWSVDSAGTSSSSTGPAVDHTLQDSSGHYLYTESSSPNYPDKVAWLVSPCIDLGALSNPFLEFWYHMYGQSMGELHVDVYSMGTWYLDIVPPLVGEQQTSETDPWKKMVAGLSQFDGQVIKVRFRGITGDNFYSDMAIDDVSFIEAPTTPEFTVSPDSAEFGTFAVGSASDTVRFFVQNLGGGTLTLLPATAITGPDAADFVLVDTSSYPVSLGAGEAVEIGVYFLPQSAGSKSAFLSIYDNSGGVTYDLPLSGTAYQLSTNTIPWLEEFVFDTLDAAYWDYYSITGTPEIIDSTGVATGTFPYGLPSEPYMLAISGTEDQLTTNYFDLSGQGSVTFSLWKSEHDLEIGEYVLIEYYASDNSWKQLDSLAGTDNGFGTFEPFQMMSYPLPQDALHDQFRIRFTAGGGMSSTDEYFFDNLELSTGGAFVMDIRQSWNLLGLPLDPPSAYYKDLFPNAIDNTLFGWNGSYYPEDTLETGEGYWLRFPAAETVSIDGTPINSVSLNLIQGWNLISGPSCEVPINQVNDPGGILIPNTLFGYDGVYQLADTVSPGEGYWIRTASAGTISLSCNSRGTNLLAKKSGQLPDISEAGAIQISDASGAEITLRFGVALKNADQLLSYSLPPLPPAGGFDARFSGDFWLDEDGEAFIQIQSSQYPVQISVDKLPAAEEGYQFVLKEIVEGEEQEAQVLSADNSVTVTNPQVTQLRLTKERLIPLTFEVSQNYPNPFNPQTTIKYSIPENQKVEIAVYNALGQKVSTLLNQYQEAGYYSINWDATNFSGVKVGSGIYFYVVKAGSHKAIKKMILLK